jgi:hypothetical protein
LIYLHGCPQKTAGIDSHATHGKRTLIRSILRPHAITYSGSRVSAANLRVATVSVLSLFDQKINPLVTPALKTLVFIMKLLLAFVLAGFLLLCVTYSTLKAECSISKSSLSVDYKTHR